MLHGDVAPKVNIVIKVPYKVCPWTLDYTAKVFDKLTFGHLVFNVRAAQIHT